MRRLCTVLLLACALLAQPPANRRQFVACPIVRDTKTQPCWLAAYKGEVYFLGLQGGVINDFYPPQLSHEVLVEGTIAEGPRACGGIPLRPVKISVMQELNPACNTMLPAEDAFEAPSAPPPPAGPAPSWVKIDGREQTTLYFDFNSDFLSLHTTAALRNIANYARQRKASRIGVTGYRAATLLSSGETLTEKPGMGEIRARKVAGILAGLGVVLETVVVNASAEAVKADGVNDPWNRRVVVVIN